MNSFFVQKSETIIALFQLVSAPFRLELENIKRALEPYLKVLHDDIKVYVEYPYVDKVYRDSYYKFYSTKHFSHDRDCARVSFFTKEITEDHFRILGLKDELEKNFLGFIVIRPTLPKLIGRLNISPKALINHQFESCICSTKSSVNGVKLEAHGFPYASQDGETLTCSETSIWGIMEYFGNKYAEYKPVLPSNIHSVLSSLSFERQIPSEGLTLYKMSFALKEFEFGVKLYAGMKNKELQRILDYYIESGIPVIAALEPPTDDDGHAVVIIGREKKDCNYFPVGYVPLSLKTKSGIEIQIYDSADIIKKYVIMDDNFPPYQTSLFEKPAEYYKDYPQNEYKIVGIVVPLYHKVYTDALHAKGLTLEILMKLDLQFSINEVILRLYLISSRSLKNEIALKVDFDNDDKEVIIRNPMPRFVWVAEFSTKEQFQKEYSFGLIVLNSTDNSIYTALNLILLPNKTIVAENGNLLVFSNKITNFRAVKNNLKGDWSSWQN